MKVIIANRQPSSSKLKITKNWPRINSELSRNQIGSKLTTPAIQPSSSAAKKLKYEDLF